MRNKCVRLKKGINIEALRNYGFIEDPQNCEDEGDTYYHLNNYFLQLGSDFRITVSTNDGHIDILCLAKESALHNVFNLSPLFELFEAGYVEFVKQSNSYLIGKRD